ncbi:MAG: lactate utilization protein [bacterium]|nr:lactate utilization protein [bacterium]
MSDARAEILSRLASATTAPAAAVPRATPPAMPDDPAGVLAARLGQNGGVLVRGAGAFDWPERIELPAPIASFDHVHCPDALALPDHGVSARGAGVEATTVQALAPLDVCVLEARFTVVENGASWHVPSSALERAAALLAEHLVIVGHTSRLVPSLHDAYPRMALGETDFGWFLSGPSKTADIEQALVFGAHGPRTMHLVLLDD